MLVWGGIGWLVDHWLGTKGIFAGHRRGHRYRRWCLPHRAPSRRLTGKGYGDRSVDRPRSGVFPPSVEDFFLPSIVPWGAHDSYWFTKITAACSGSRSRRSSSSSWSRTGNRRWCRPRSSGSPRSIYGFVRNNIAIEMIGQRGFAFAPYLDDAVRASSCVMNLFAILPFVQISPNSHIAFPAMLAVISYVMFIYVGIRKHGAGQVPQARAVPPAPWFILPLLIPIEFFSTFLVRPFSLAVRLFANMFAGHMLLLVFTLGGFAMINANGLLRAVLGALLGDDHRADVPGVPGHLPAGLRLHGADRELRPGRARRRALS